MGERSACIVLPLEKTAFFHTLGSEIIHIYVYHICSESTFLLSSFVRNGKQPCLHNKLHIIVLLMTMMLEFQLLVCFQVEVVNLMEINHCTMLPFVGGGYNRILLAFRSLLCGQMHLNVSTASCLFRNRLEIGNTNASRAPITCRLGLYPRLIVYAGLLWITVK